MSKKQETEIPKRKPKGDNRDLLAEALYEKEACRIDVLDDSEVVAELNKLMAARLNKLIEAGLNDLEAAKLNDSGAVKLNDLEAAKLNEVMEAKLKELKAAGLKKKLVAKLKDLIEAGLNKEMEAKLNELMAIRLTQYNFRPDFRSPDVTTVYGHAPSSSLLHRLYPELQRGFVEIDFFCRYSAAICEVNERTLRAYKIARDVLNELSKPYEAENSSTLDSGKGGTIITGMGKLLTTITRTRKEGKQDPKSLASRFYLLREGCYSELDLQVVNLEEARKKFEEKKGSRIGGLKFEEVMKKLEMNSLTKESEAKPNDFVLPYAEYLLTQGSEDLEEIERDSNKKAHEAGVENQWTILRIEKEAEQLRAKDLVRAVKSDPSWYSFYVKAQIGSGKEGWEQMSKTDYLLEDRKVPFIIKKGFFPRDSLDDLVVKNGLTFRDFLLLLQKAAEDLDVAHKEDLKLGKKGIIHANLSLGKIKVRDVGSGLEMIIDGWHNGLLTENGEITEEYKEYLEAEWNEHKRGEDIIHIRGRDVSNMAPESLSYGNPVFDVRSDVYTFWMCFFKALTGYNPFPLALDDYRETGDRGSLDYYRGLKEHYDNYKKQQLDSREVGLIPVLKKLGAEKYMIGLAGIVRQGISGLPENRFQNMQETLEALKWLSKELEKYPTLAKAKVSAVGTGCVEKREKERTKLSKSDYRPRIAWKDMERFSEKFGLDMHVLRQISRHIADKENKYLDWNEAKYGGFAVYVFASHYMANGVPIVNKNGEGDTTRLKKIVIGNKITLVPIKEEDREYEDFDGIKIFPLSGNEYGKRLEDTLHEIGITKEASMIEFSNVPFVWSAQHPTVVMTNNQEVVVPYMRQSHFPGEPWESFVQGDVSVKKAWQLSLKLAASVSALHGAGIVHGDLNDGNILVNDMGEEADIGLIDLGWALRLNDEHSLTLLPKDYLEKFPEGRTLPEEFFVGSPLFVSPEMYRYCYKADNLPFCDQYAFGMNLYMLWTGGNVPYQYSREIEEDIQGFLFDIFDQVNGLLEGESGLEKLKQSFPEPMRDSVDRAVEDYFRETSVEERDGKALQDGLYGKTINYLESVKRLNEDYTDPSEYNQAIPKVIRDVVNKCLQGPIGERFSSMQEVFDYLQQGYGQYMNDHSRRSIDQTKIPACIERTLLDKKDTKKKDPQERETVVIRPPTKF